MAVDAGMAWRRHTFQIPSTADELIAYFRNAGLEAIRVEQCDSRLMVAGVKNSSDDTSRRVDSGSK
jgi:hypothetical protein